MTADAAAGPASTRRRWDGQRWVLRAGIAAAPVLATAGLPAVVRDELGAIALVCALWIPLISLSQWSSLRFPGPVTALATAVVDLAVLLVLTQVAPGLVPVLVVLTTVVAAIHVRVLTTAAPQLAVAIGALAVQVAMVAGRDLGALVPAIVTLDIAASATIAHQLAESARDERRSSAALNRAGQLTDAVLTGIGEAVVVTGASGRITSTNGAAEVTFGTAVSGSCADALKLHAGAAELDCTNGCPLLDDATEVGQADVSRAHPSGTRQALLVNVRAVRDPLGRVREVVHSFRDITAIKQAEQAKTLFLATASHELKTPLAIITGFVDLLDKDAVPPARRREVIDTIQARGKQLTGIIDRLLLASRIEGGGVTLSTTPTDAVPIVAERVRALREVTGRDLTFREPTVEVPSVDADATGLATVVDHLVENAVKYSPDGGSIEVTMRVLPDTVDVEVTDHGVGMTTTAAEQCFDAFWQAESIDSRRFGGSGVGLYIVRSLSRAMGGDTMVARSAPGVGTTFRVRLQRSDLARPAPVEETPSTSAVDDVLRQVGVGRD